MVEVQWAECFCERKDGLMVMLRRRAEDRWRCGNDLRDSLMEEPPQTDNDSASDIVHANKLANPVSR